MIELLNSKVVRVAMAMVAFTAGCAAPVDDAGDVEMDEAEAVEVGEDSQALTGLGCGDLLRIPFRPRYPISSLRNCGGWGGPWGGYGSWGGGLGGFGNYGGGLGWGGFGNYGGGYGGNWFPGAGVFSPCSGGIKRFPYGFSPYGGAYPFGPNTPC